MQDLDTESQFSAWTLHNGRLIEYRREEKTWNKKIVKKTLGKTNKFRKLYDKLVDLIPSV